MDVEAIEALGTRFQYAFVAAVVAGLLAVVSLAWLLAPGDVMFYALVGTPVVIYLGAMLIAVATRQHVEAVGHLVTTGGWVLVLLSTGTWMPAVLADFGVVDLPALAGFAVVFLGGITALAADHRGRLRAVVSRSG